MTFYAINRNAYPIRTTTRPRQPWWSMGATMPNTIPKNIRNYPTFNKYNFGSNIPRFR